MANVGKKITIQEFSRLVGVAPSTVSKALAGTGRMSEATRKRICQAAEEMNYRPSLVAANLRGRKTNTIGVIVPDIGSNVFSAVVREVEKFAGQRDYNLILCTSGGHFNEERKYAQMLMQRRVEGVIAVPYGERVNHDCSHFQELQRLGIPVVLVEQNIPGSGLPLVVLDNFDGAKRLTLHMVGAGHRRIVFVGNTLKDWDYAGRERFAGYREALADSGIKFDEALVMHSGMDIPARLAELRASAEPPTAVFAVCDFLALRLISSLHQAGVAVPEDLSVVGFDDIDISAHYLPALTTVLQPTGAMGRRAAEILFDIIDEKLNPRETPVYERLPCHLMVRQSCAALKNK